MDEFKIRNIKRNDKFYGRKIPDEYDDMWSKLPSKKWGRRAARRSSKQNYQSSWYEEYVDVAYAWTDDYWYTHFDDWDEIDYQEYWEEYKGNQK